MILNSNLKLHYVLHYLHFLASDIIRFLNMNSSRVGLEIKLYQKISKKSVLHKVNVIIIKFSQATTQFIKFLIVRNLAGPSVAQLQLCLHTLL